MSNTEQTATADAPKTGSIIGDKYKGKYKGSSDWIGDVIEQNAYTVLPATEGTPAVAAVEAKPADGDTPAVVGVAAKPAVPGKPERYGEVDLEKLFELAEANKIDVSKYRPQADEPNAPGRLRMTIGNMLRARAKRRHGLIGLDGETLTPPADFIAGNAKTEELDGTKIAKEKPAKPEVAPAAEGDSASATAE